MILLQQESRSEGGPGIKGDFKSLNQMMRKQIKTSAAPTVRGKILLNRKQVLLDCGSTSGSKTDLGSVSSRAGKEFNVEISVMKPNLETKTIL